MRGFEGYAIDRAGRYTQLTTGAFATDDRVRKLGRTEDGVDRAGRNANGATYTGVFIYACDGWGHWAAKSRVQSVAAATEQLGQCGHQGVAAGRTLVDVRGPTDDRFRVGSATGVAALGALRLRQQGMDLFYGGLSALWQLS